ncbi:MAG: sporulation protein YunB [Bacillota bacterium]
MYFKYKRWYRSFLITCISVMIVSIISLIYINYKLRPLILDIAETKITQYVNEAMSLAVHHTIYQDLSSDDLLEFQYNQTGRVVSYNINLQLENQLKSHMYERVDLYLKYLEQGIILNQSDILMTDQRRKQTFSDLDQRKDETVFTIPLGQALDLPLFQNLGPKIPIELEVTGFVNAELETKLTPLQINSMHIEPVVHLTVEIRTLVPFASRKATLKQVIPLGSGGFIGDVPDMYYYPGMLDGAE